MNKALLVIDMQEGYVEKYPSCLLPRINEKIQRAAANHEPIIYAKNTKRLRSGKQCYSCNKKRL